MSDKIDTQSSIALYVQLKTIILERIRTGAWKPGDRIPSEEALKDTFSVSRATVRQALADLEFEGHLLRQKGRGTFISQPKIETTLRHPYSFAEEMTARGLVPETRLVTFDIVVRNNIATEVLGLSTHDPLIKMARLRLANGEPIMLETTYIPENIVPNLTEDDIATGSLYKLLEERYQLRLERAIESFEPILIDDFASKMLEVPKGSPALYLERVGYLKNERRIEFSQSIVRGDRCRYFVELLR